VYIFICSSKGIIKRDIRVERVKETNRGEERGLPSSPPLLFSPSPSPSLPLPPLSSSHLPLLPPLLLFPLPYLSPHYLRREGKGREEEGEIKSNT
jgi:hypothetical protein